MRPLKLTMQAFGPYPHKEELDFGALKDVPLFLIHGPTGAGKTSILDAISFALYGQASGKERTAEGMRSHHADDATATEVTFTFQLGDAVYRVLRSPTQELQKKRGTGTTEKKAEAILWKKGSDGKWEVQTERTTLVTAAIERLLGFKCDQFRQVVLLPQGKFRDLLSATSKDRQEILQELFHTHFFQKIQEALKEAANVGNKEVKVLYEKRQQRFIDFEVKNILELEKKHSATQDEKKATEAQIRDLKQEEHLLGKKQAEAKEIIRKINEFGEAQEALRMLQTEEENFIQKRRRLEEAQKALSLQASERELRTREQESAEAQQKLQSAYEAEKKATKEHKRAKEALEKEQSRKQESENLKKEALFLENLRPQVAKLSEARQRLAEFEGLVRNLSSVHKEKEAIVKQSRQAFEESQKKAKLLSEKAGQSALYQVEYEKCKEAFGARQRLQNLKKKHKEAEADFSQTENAKTQAEKKLLSLRKKREVIEERWRQEQAAVLARSLQAGTPCPVCGSHEHPLPAQGTGDLPSEEELASAKDATKETEKILDKLRKESEEKKTNLIQIQAESKSLEKELGEKKKADLAKLEKERKEAEARFVEAQKAEEEFAGIAKKQQKLEDAQKKAQEELESSQEKQHEAEKKYAAAKASVEELEKQVPEELRSSEELLKKQKEISETLKKREDALEKASQEEKNAGNALTQAKSDAKNAKESEEKACSQAEKLRKEFLGLAKKAGFASIKEYESARMEEQEMKRLDEEIKAFHDKLTKAKGVAIQKQKEAEGLKKPDLKSIEAELESTKEKLEGALRQEGELQRRIEMIEKAVVDLQKLEKQIQKKEKASRIRQRLADVAGGKNPRNIDFERFVLAGLFEDVLSVASERLKLMSKGRFALRRESEPQDRRSAGGLGLVVFDSYTGQERPARTLSGGEGFLASLSLALGLADVIQSYAGGIQLDMMLIDEGFGSLDSEALDLAVKTLLDLRTEGRIVGIISHVPELKELINLRLEVNLLPSKAGSTARFVG